MDLNQYCEICGKMLMEYDEQNNIFIRHDHSVCYKIRKYEKLSIFDKNAKINTFEISVPDNPVEATYIESFKIYCSKFSIAVEKGIGILFSGNAGTGKTFHTNCIANELKSNGYTVLSFNLSGYFQELRQAIDKKENAKEAELLQAVKLVDLIIIDDVGNENISESWGKEKLFNLFNTIYLNKKCCIVTTNLSAKELQKHFEIGGSGKILDRLLELCKPFVFDWKSRRAAIGKKNFEEIF